MIKNLPATTGDVGLIPGSRRSPGEGNGNPFQYSCLGNPTDKRSLLDYSPWVCKRVGHDLATEQHSNVNLYTHLCIIHRSCTVSSARMSSKHCSESAPPLLHAEINTQNVGPALRPTQWVPDPQWPSAQGAQASSARPSGRASSTFLVPCDLRHQITGWFGVREQRLSSWNSNGHRLNVSMLHLYMAYFIWPYIFLEGKQNDLKIGPTRGPWARIP